MIITHIWSFLQNNKQAQLRGSRGFIYVIRSSITSLISPSGAMSHHDKHFQALNSLISSTAHLLKSDSHLCNRVWHENRQIAGTAASNLSWSRWIRKIQILLYWFDWIVHGITYPSAFMASAQHFTPLSKNIWFCFYKQITVICRICRLTKHMSLISEVSVRYCTS